jgi:hypothetical protein
MKPETRRGVTEMPSDESKSSLILEFEEFQRKFEAAVRLTWSDLRREAEKVLDAARHQRAGKVRDINYFLDMLLGQATVFVLQNFKPIAAVARRSSSANLLSSNLLFQEVLHGAPHYITANLQDSISLLCKLYESPASAASFNERFRLLFAEEWGRLVCEAELEIEHALERSRIPVLEVPPQPPTQPQRVSGDARSRALGGESSKGAVDQKRRGENEFRRRIICDAAAGGLEGPEYCSYIHDHGLQTPELLQRRGCPKSYPAGYKIERWRKSIQQEKTRVVKESGNDRGKKSSKPDTIH